MTRQPITKAELRVEVQQLKEDTDAVFADAVDLLTERQLRPGPLASLSFARRVSMPKLEITRLTPPQGGRFASLGNC